jgi:hypothetical protein
VKFISILCIVALLVVVLVDTRINAMGNSISSVKDKRADYGCFVTGRCYALYSFITKKALNAIHHQEPEVPLEKVLQLFR